MTGDEAYPTQEIRRCSFCGKTPISYDEVIRAQHNRHVTWVWCPNQQCDNYGKKWALSAWNTRPIEDELQETITAIEHAVAQVYGHLTGGKMTKCNTDPEQAIAIIETEFFSCNDLGFDRDGNEIPRMPLSWTQDKIGEPIHYGLSPIHAILADLAPDSDMQAENARLRAGITQFAEAMNEPDWAWNEMTDAQQEAYNALVTL